MGGRRGRWVVCLMEGKSFRTFLEDSGRAESVPEDLAVSILRGRLQRRNVEVGDVFASGGERWRVETVDLVPSRRSVEVSMLRVAVGQRRITVSGGLAVPVQVTGLAYSSAYSGAYG